MCIYCGSDDYRKIYEQHYGSIPKEDNGRTYEIHHIDGNHFNNNPANLKAVTLQGHYDIHKSQNDWGACYMIGLKLSLSFEELSVIMTNLANKRVENGTHNFLGNKNPSRIKSKNGTHHFSKRSDGSSVTSDRVKNGTNPFLNAFKGQENPAYDHAIYVFKNIHTKEILETTQFNLRKSYNLNSGNLSEMINGNRKSVGGWSLLKTE